MDEIYNIRGMKKVILSFAVLLLLFATCKEKEEEKDEPCKIDRPKDVKPIDWENYNDVYTVYWNCYFLYSEFESRTRDMQENIMVYGWICTESVSVNMLYLGSDKDNCNPSIPIEISFYAENDSLVYQMQTMLDSCAITKKCFIKGRLAFKLDTPECTKCIPFIEVYDINDIYFK